MTTTQVSLIIQNIKCIEAGENGGDELYIKYSADNNAEVRYPASGYQEMDDGTDWVPSPQLVISYQSTLLISLWDQDSVSSDDPRGQYTYSAEQANEALTETYKESGGDGEYQITSGPN